MAYAIYLDGLRLPLAPSQISMKIKNQNKTLNLLSGDEINIIQAPGLTEITFDAVLPAFRYPFAVYEGGFLGAEYFIAHIGDLKAQQKPCRFVLVREAPGGAFLSDVNMAVTVEDYTQKDDAAEGLDLTLSLKLKQYREYGTRITKISPTKKSGSKAPRPADTAPKEKTHKVVKGDCLWNIAQQYLGDGNRYPEIYTLNKDVIDKGNAGTGNPRYTIYPGQVFRLPEK